MLKKSPWLRSEEENIISEVKETACMYDNGYGEAGSTWQKLDIY